MTYGWTGPEKTSDYAGRLQDGMDPARFSCASAALVSQNSLGAVQFLRIGVEGSMPHYEFFCNACKKAFLKILTVAEHDAGQAPCPHCGSREVEQRWSAFSAVTSKKSA